jgi:hypothetical protein
LGYLADAVARGHFVRLAIAADGSAMAFVEASKALRLRQRREHFAGWGVATTRGQREI